MDAASQQASAVIREGDPSQPRPSNTEVKVDAVDAAKKSESKSKSKDASKGTEKKKTKRSKKKQSDTGGLKKNKKKKKAISTDSSSGSSDDSTKDSDSDSEQDEKDAILARKRAVKKPQDTRKTKVPSWVKGLPESKAATETDSDSSDSDSETEEEDEEEASPVPPPRSSKKNKNEKSDAALIIAAVTELLQHTQLQPQSPFQPQIGGIGTGLGGTGFGGGLNSGFSALNLSQPPGRSLWMPPAGHNPMRLGQALQGKTAGIDDVHDGIGDASVDPSRSRLGLNPKGGKNATRGSAAKSTSPKKLDYKRVDQVWDNTIHNFKLQDTAKFASETKYDGFCFHVRRTFDWEGKYKSTVVDIKSKILRECLQDVIGNIKGVSLVDETPKLDPNVLFL